MFLRYWDRYYTGAVPHVVVLLEERVVLYCPLLELHVNAAAVDTDNAPDTTDKEKNKDKQ